jgi:hypothetical protein
MKISTGLRNALMGGIPARMAGTVATITAGTIAAVDGGAGADSFTDSDNGFVTAGFDVGDSILALGFTGGMAGIVGPFTIVTVAAGTIEVATGLLANDAATESVTLIALKGGSLRNLFKRGILVLYSGAMPATADAAETGTKLLEVTVESGAFTAGAPANGLQFGAPSSGTISKDAETWSGVGLATGEAGYYVFYDNTYTTGISTTAIRFMGSCSESLGDLILSDCTVTASASKTITAFSVTMPAT